MQSTSCSNSFSFTLTDLQYQGTSSKSVPSSVLCNSLQSHSRMTSVSGSPFDIQPQNIPASLQLQFPNVIQEPLMKPAIVESTTLMLKTPVSLLNEICAKAKVAPNFMTTEDGPPHDRRFECTVKVEKQGLFWEGKGNAKAKKDARQEAAKSLLVSMDNQIEDLLIPTKPIKEEIPHTVECDPDVSGNPVGELNDLCMKFKRLPPEYEELGEEGRPHERVFTVACKIGSQLVEQGRGRSKKQAKKVAAHKVKQSLTEMIRNMDEANSIKEEEGSIVEKLQELTLSKKISQVNTNKSNWKLKEWFSEFKDRTGDKWLSLLQNNTTLISPCPKRLLSEIAEEQKFKVDYLDIAAAESTEEFSAILSIGMEPVAIFLGKGRSKTEARKNAAEKSIEFMKIAIKNC